MWLLKPMSEKARSCRCTDFALDYLRCMYMYYSNGYVRRKKENKLHFERPFARKHVDFHRISF